MFVDEWSVCFLLCAVSSSFFFFFFNDTATTEIYTLSLHDALPISCCGPATICCRVSGSTAACSACSRRNSGGSASRSEEHTSELQSQSNLVCRLLLEKKKKNENDQIRDRTGQSDMCRRCSLVEIVQ